MKKILFLPIIIAIMSLSACGTLEVSLDQTPTPAVDAGQVATIVAATLTAFPSPTIEPTIEPTATLAQPKHEFAVYGVKAVAYSMSNFEAGKQNLPLYKYVTQHTDIFSYGLEQKSVNLLFSDETLPIFILSTPGGGDVALHDIVAISPATGKLYARMMPRDQYISYEPPGSLYELSTDGTNHYRKIFDFERPVSFVISQDGTKIAYIPNESINNHSVVVRALDSGDEISRLDLSEFNSYWISSISWASDSKTLLINLGDTPLTIKNTDTKTGCYLVDIYSKAMHKLVGPLFQTPTELASGYKTDPFGYSYLPNSNRLIGVARKYETGVSSPFVTLYSVDLEGTNLTELPLGFNEDVWRISLSPSGKYVAYQCQETMLCETNFQDNLSEIIAQPIQQKEEIDQQQTIIGWLEN